MGSAPELSPENLHAYWVCAVVLLSLDAAALAYLARRTYLVRHKALVVRSFATLLLGDACFVACYLPHHLHNLIAWGTSVAASKASPECRVVSTALSVSYGLMCGGVPIASFQPYFLVNASFALSRQWAIRPRALLASVLLCSAIGVAFEVAALLGDYQGPYRGLYCGTRSYTWQSGGITALYTIGCAALATVGFVLTRRALKRAKESAVAAGHLVRSSRTILSLSLKVTVCFWLSYTPLAISSALLVTLGVYMPEWFEMLSGLLVKLKVLVDVVVVLSLPVFRHAEDQPPVPRGAQTPIQTGRKEGVAVWARPEEAGGPKRAFEMQALMSHESADTGPNDSHRPPAKHEDRAMPSAGRVV